MAVDYEGQQRLLGFPRFGDVIGQDGSKVCALGERRPAPPVNFGVATDTLMKASERPEKREASDNGAAADIVVKKPSPEKAVLETVLGIPRMAWKKTPAATVSSKQQATWRGCQDEKVTTRAGA